MAVKAFPGENSATVDEMILGQIICEYAEEKIRMHLIERAPSTPREALLIAAAHQAAIKYNESLRETMVSSMHNEIVQEDYSYTQGGKRAVIKIEECVAENENMKMMTEETVIINMMILRGAKTTEKNQIIHILIKEGQKIITIHRFHHVFKE